MRHPYLLSILFTVLLAPLGAAQAQAPVITSVVPMANASAVLSVSPLYVNFNQTLTASSASALKVFSSQRGGLRTHATPATVSDSSLSFAPSAYPFMPGETVSYTVTTAAAGNSGTLGHARVGQFMVAAGGAGQGIFRLGSNPAMGGYHNGVVLGDVDGDGDLDIATASEGNNNNGIVSIRLNGGDATGSNTGTFSGSQDVAVGNMPAGVALGDVDGDGDLDLVAVTGGTGSSLVSVRLNGGNASGSNTGIFSGTQEVLVGTYAYSLALGDVDGDGDLDLLAANVIDNNVSVCLNGGDATGSNTGIFSGTQTVPVGNHPFCIVLGDVDSDGDLDLLTANRDGGTVSVRLNGGNATGSNTGIFSGTQNVSVGSTLFSVAVGDVDGDGDLDLLTANSGSNTASVRLNGGNASGSNTGIFSGGQDLPVGYSPWSVTVGDVDGDGDLDLLCANAFSNTVSVRLNGGDANGTNTGIFSGSQNVAVSIDPYGVTVGDVDGDGDLDLLTASYASGAISVRLNGGTNLTPALVTTNVVPTANAHAVARTSPLRVNFNQSLTAASAGALKVFSSQRGGLRTHATPATVSGSALSFTPSAYPWMPGETVNYTVTAGAAGNGGVLARPRVGQFTAAVGGTGRGYFQPSSNAQVGDSPVSAVLGDIDGDGDLDLLTANMFSYSVSICLNDGRGGFGNVPGREMLNINRPTCIALGDLDGDGDLDLLFSQTLYSPAVVSIRFNDGLGHFSGSQDLATSSNSNSIVLGDVDGDGDLDLLTNADGFPGLVSVQLNNGSGIFGGSQTTAVGSFPASIVMGDVDNDGDLDMIVACGPTPSSYLPSSVSIRLNDGNGHFSGSQDLTMAANSLITGDWDGDGDLDLLSASPTTNAVNIRLNDGTGTFGSNQSVVVPNIFNSVAAGDVDGDGDLDLLGATGSTAANSAVNICLNNGSGSFSTGPSTAVGLNPHTITMADLDGDADLDFVVQTLNTYGTSNRNLANACLNQQALATASQTTTASLALFPNPAHTTATLTGTTSLAPIEVLDALGRAIFTTTADAEGTATLTLPAIAPGLYLVRCGTQVRRLAVE